MAQLSADLNRFLFEEERSPQITLSDVMTIAGERLFGFVFALLGLILVLPFPVPGHAIPFGLVILLLAVQLIFGAQTPWLPKWLVNKPVSLEKIQGIIKMGLPWLKRLEFFSRPRMTYVCHSFIGRLAIGIGMTIMGLLIMIPVPGVNSICGLPVLITGVGMLDDDGAISLAGLGVAGALLLAAAGLSFSGSTLLKSF